MNLVEIGWKHDTDKAPHGFLAEYEKRFGHLRDEPITLLEIGTWDGRSLKTWREYFANAKIVGMEINPLWIPEPSDNIFLIRGDQENNDHLAIVAAHGPFDVIIDDGGHLPSNHIMSFNFLWRYVKPGGWYFIEDSFTLFNDCWTKPNDFTILDIIRNNLAKQVLCSTSDLAEIQIVGGDKHPNAEGRGHDDGLICFRKKV